MNALVLELLTLCDQAAAAITTHYYDEKTSGLLRKKADASPLTAADLASHQILSDGLRQLAPGTPILSEESEPRDLASRLDWPRLWMLDPLDGTREFLDRTGEFTINMAFIEDQRPIFGIIYRPLQRQGFVGIEGAGAWRVWPDGGSWRSEAMRTRSLPGKELMLLASSRHRNDRLKASLAFFARRRVVKRKNSGSALKFCDLALGEGDCYPRFSPCSEWDVAAGDALVTAAGGKVVGLDGERLRYNVRETLLSPHFLAVGDPQKTIWNELLEILH